MPCGTFSRHLCNKKSATEKKLFDLIYVHVLKILRARTEASMCVPNLSSWAGYVLSRRQKRSTGRSKRPKAACRFVANTDPPGDKSTCFLWALVSFLTSFVVSMTYDKRASLLWRLISVLLLDDSSFPRVSLDLGKTCTTLSLFN